MSEFYLTAESPLAKQPNIKLSLLDSQLASLYACQKFEQELHFERILRPSKNQRINKHVKFCIANAHITFNTNIAILADITGYGKSMVVLCLVLTGKPPQTPIKNSGRDYVPTSVLVAPNKLISQWVSEAKKTGLQYSIVSNSDDSVNFAADIIFCRASRYNYFIAELSKGLLFHRVIFDEIDSINISKMATPHANLIWLVTATPEAIQYSYGTGWLKNSINKCSSIGLPGYNYSLYDFLSIRCDPDFTKSCSPIPPIKKTFIRCLTPAHINLLKDYVPASVLDKLNAGDLVGAVQAMGGGESSTTNIIDIITARFDKRIAEKMEHIQNMDNTKYTLAEKKERLLKFKQDITVLETDKADFLKKLDNVSEQTCSICYDDINNLCMTPCCNAFFCHGCISTWFKENTSCPMCRTNICVSTLIIYNPNVKKNKIVAKKKAITLKTKEDTVMKLLKDHPKGKFLIFSDHDPTGKALSKKIVAAGISYAQIAGHAGTIKKALVKSEEGKTKVLFMNARKDGAGLNMPWIDNVIIYHKLSDSVLTQVLGRTSRLGQTKEVNAWFLEYEHEYDENYDPQSGDGDE